MSMKKRHRTSPVLEECEPRRLLSAGIVSRPVGLMAASAPHQKVLALNGTFRGSYQSGQSIPDVGTTFDFTGSGHVHGVGKGFVTGHIGTLGFIAEGHSQGTLFLSGVRGTITLQLTGPQQSGFSRLPDHFTFTVVGGTGKYRHVADSGVASLVVLPGPGGVTRSPFSTGQGTFTLVLTSNPVRTPLPPVSS
jgi:hypothetical protein